MFHYQKAMVVLLQDGHELEDSEDWPKFRNDVEVLLQRCGKEQGTGYRLKHQLVEAR